MELILKQHCWFNIGAEITVVITQGRTDTMNYEIFFRQFRTKLPYTPGVQDIFKQQLFSEEVIMVGMSVYVKAISSIFGKNR